ncbi:hypothetical protein TPB0596_04680 [Tsukamurella pulmonis]|uniref:DUF2637 domain-containing protein n=1 Tax=Tsukamurella pulmonis TaxID=47312 RepID=UPI001EDD0254|nr:DUF2637 domain-containing protein [Tsukamurella pulmonis]BDD80705.1 hypothetical protein TPB0596_04680 [Tsukamurella pulmonis]
MTTTTPTPEALRHRAAARRWARSGEWGFTIASSAVNVTVVAAAGGSLLRILLAGLAPIVLAKMAHLLAKVLQSGIMVSGVHWGVNLIVAGAVTLIGAGAFTLSFDSLRRAAEPDHGQLAWVFPATLDLAIVVCAAVLAVIAWADEQDQRNGVPPRVTVWNRITARFAAEQLPAQEPVTAAQVTSPEPVTTTPVTEQLIAPDAQLTSPEDDAITAPIPAAQQGEQRPVTSGDAVTDQPAAHRDSQVNGAGHQEVVTTAQLAADDQEPAAQDEVSVAQLPTAASEQQIDPERDAQVLRERGARLGEEQLTDVIARIAAGQSFSSISEATGISRNTVRKIAGQVPTEPEPALA